MYRSPASIVSIASMATTMALLLSGLNSAQAQTCQKDRPSPVAPTNLFDVGIVNASDSNVRRAFIPALSTTRDGRIGLAKGESNKRGLTIYLLKPEIESNVNRAAGARPLAMVDYSMLSSVVKTISISTIRKKFPQAIPSGSLMHAALCEPRKSNPIYDSTRDEDQYLFSAVGFEPGSPTRNETAWTFGIEVRVKNPKSTLARIESVSLTNTFGKKEFERFNVGLEPTITADGRLLVVRTPIRYSYNVKGPCDPTGWTEAQPLMKARADANLQNADGSYKYGFLRYPFRDAMGQPLEELNGGYPWIDSEGDNLFYLALNRSMGRRSDSKLPFSCSGGGSRCDHDEDRGEFRGVAVIGLWTHGKATLLDGILNNTDYPATASSDRQKLVHLYAGHAGVRIAGNRFSTSLTRQSLTGPAYENLSIIEGLENKLNYDRALNPTTPRDVVWKVTRGAVTDEVVFDEFVDPNYLIFSEMVGAVEGTNGTYFDGFQKGSSGCYSGEVRIQNAASSIRYKNSVPAYGSLIKPNQGRIEPVALGGIRGKGLFLSEDNALYYDLVPREIAAATTTYFSTFFDVRNSEPNQWINLVKTPNGARIQVFMAKSGDLEKFRVMPTSGESIAFSFKTPLSRREWFHLAAVESSSHVTFIINGNEAVSSPITGRNALSLLGLANSKSRIEIGRGSATAKGLNGWIDDVRLIVNADVYLANPELACNMAHGTMLRRVAGKGKQALINRYNLSSHAGVFCNTQYDFDEYTTPDAHKGLKKSEFRHVRDSFIKKGEKIVFDLPRPDSTSNMFCLTCHVDGGDRFRPDSLKVKALEKNELDAQADFRRQPLQPPSIWHGFMPKDYFKSVNTGKLGPSVNRPNCGSRDVICRIDRFLFD